MLQEVCAKRGLMSIWDEKKQSWEDRRKEIVQMLCNEEYGIIPISHTEVTWKVESEEKDFCAGKVTLKKIRLIVCFEEGTFSFPFYSAIPNSEGKHPFFVHINSTENVPDRYMPTEEICDRGFAVLSFGCQDVAVDDAVPLGLEYDNRLQDILFKSLKKEGNHCGKLAMWAWATSRIMDYACTQESLDLNSANIIGLSRLGKAALLAGVLDERFTCAIACDSGCSGPAVSRGKKGETIKLITDRFGYWFCGNYKKYADNEDRLPFDQHFLLAAMAPRRVYIASAVEDEWADPESEFLSCFAASEVYEKLGIKGLVCEDKWPDVGENFHMGNIAYHIRKGTHYLSRDDWNRFMDYIIAQNEGRIKK